MRPIPASAKTCSLAACCREVAARHRRRIVFFCAFGERSAMAVAAAKKAGLAHTAHIEAASMPGRSRRPVMTG